VGSSQGAPIEDKKKQPYRLLPGPCDHKGCAMWGYGDTGLRFSVGPLFARQWKLANHRIGLAMQLRGKISNKNASSQRKHGCLPGVTWLTPGCAISRPVLMLGIRDNQGFESVLRGLCSPVEKFANHRIGPVMAFTMAQKGKISNKMPIVVSDWAA